MSQSAWKRATAAPVSAASRFHASEAGNRVRPNPSRSMSPLKSPANSWHRNSTRPPARSSSRARHRQRIRCPEPIRIPLSTRIATRVSRLGATLLLVQETEDQLRPRPILLGIDVLHAVSRQLEHFRAAAEYRTAAQPGL